MSSLVVLLIHLTVSFAEPNCSCPVLTCDPCQVRISLEDEYKRCSDGTTLRCQKFVCENTNNYFQCLSGKKPLYVPPESVVQYITTPVDPKEVKTPINKINADALYKTIVTSDEQETPQEEIQRAPASVKKPVVKELMYNVLEPEPPATQVDFQAAAESTFRISKIQWPRGKKRSKWPLRKGAVLTRGQTLQFPRNTKLIISSKNLKVQFRFLDESKVTFKQQGPALVASFEKATVVFDVLRSNVAPFVVDLGAWRLGKFSGQAQLHMSKTGQVKVSNQQDSLWLRRDALIAQAEEVREGKSFSYVAGEDFVSFADRDIIPESLPKQIHVGESRPPRMPASEGFACQLPRAKYQQCAWKCFGEKKTSVSCGKSQASKCVRFTCSVDGEWKLPTLSSGSECYVDKIRVGQCF